MRRVFLLIGACLVISVVLAPAATAQSGGFDPTSYDISEYNPNGPCFDPAVSSDVVGVPIEELPNAYLNRNDPVGTPISSPLDPDRDGIACNSLTQAQAQQLGREAFEASQQEDDTSPGCPAGLVPGPQTPDGRVCVIAEEQTTPTQMTALPDTGGLPLQALAVAGGVLLVGGGLLLRRRMS